MPYRRTDPTTYTNSYGLRHNQTEEESRLWIFLRSHRLNNVHFRRQHAIGKYVVDFCAPRLKLVIEVDGGQHVDQEEYDIERTAYLESKGYRVCVSGIMRSEAILRKYWIRFPGRLRQFKG